MHRAIESHRMTLIFTTMMTKSDEMLRSEAQQDIRYLTLLSKKFPTVAEACTEIINLEAILDLPKGTEHFLTDLHGEYEAFQHVLKNASGSVSRKVDEIFGQTLRESERKELCTLIYYPEEKLKLVRAAEDDLDGWYRITLHQLIKVARAVSAKYTRSKVSKALPPAFAYIMQELLHESLSEPKQGYVNVIISTIIEIGRADHFIIAMCELIQRLTIDSLHIVGDIFDRGPGAHIILDTLLKYHDIDVQWGNHDILWMGAACGNEACIANVLRIALRYGNLPTIEDGYGINLLPLATFAMDVYGEDECEMFMPTPTAVPHSEKTKKLIAKMQKAIAIMQFKVEGHIINRNPDYEMNDRNLLERIDYENKTIVLGGKTHELCDKNLPTIDPKDPYKLTDEEASVMEKLRNSFVNSDKMRKHMRWLYAKGSLYLVRNSNLMFHASVPLNEDGTFMKVRVHGEEYSGKALFDKVDSVVRDAYYGNPASDMHQRDVDYMWYLWCGPHSPFFDKDKMTNFEKYFVADKEMKKEKKGYYYTLRNEYDICVKVLKEFGLEGPHSHIINGHVPVKVAKGEQPVKAGGKLLVIDGGFSKAYQSETGIAGYTLIYHSRGLQLVQHEPFQSTQKAIEEGMDIISNRFVLEFNNDRKRVRDTDIGKELESQIDELKKLLCAYRMGLIKEKE